MAITISSQSASYYSAANYQSSLQKSGSDYRTNSGGNYKVSDPPQEKETPKSTEAAAYDKISDLYSTAKSSLELSKLSLLEATNTGQASFASITNIKSHAQTQQKLESISGYGEMQSVANSATTVARDDSALKNLYDLLLEEKSQKTDDVQNTLAIKQSISSYMRAESNFKGTLRIFDATV